MHGSATDTTHVPFGARKYTAADFATPPPRLLPHLADGMRRLAAILAGRGRRDGIPDRARHL